MQTNEDDIECDTQTEETEVCDKWSQHPPEDFNCAGGTVYYVLKVQNIVTQNVTIGIRLLCVTTTSIIHHSSPDRDNH